MKVLPFLQICVFFLKRFIDDGFGIWLHHPDPDINKRNWDLFQNSVNNGGLSWTFSQRSNSAVFMDLNITIEGGKLETSLYSKPMALHLYIPPHSAHPPGIITGLIMGQILRIYQLNSKQRDKDKDLRNFYTRLLDRGYHSEFIMPLF